MLNERYEELDKLLNNQILEYNASTSSKIKNLSRLRSRLICSLLDQNRILKTNFFSVRKKELMIRKNYSKIKLFAASLECEKNQLEARLNIIKDILKEKDVKSVKAKLKSFDINFSPIRMSNVSRTPVKKEKSRQSAGSILDDDNFSDPGNEKTHISIHDHNDERGLEHYFDVIGDTFVSFPHVAEEKKIRFEDLDFISNKEHHESFNNFNRLNKPHCFETKSALKVDHCGICGKRIDFGKTFLRCGQCSIKIHISCKSPRLQPCLNLRNEISSMNSSILSNSDLNTSDISVNENSNRKINQNLDKIDLSLLCPDYENPCIPAIVILCIHEISARGFDHLGLYRLSGSDKATKELFEKLLAGKYPPPMALIMDLNIICGCLKMFFRRLDSPLIPPRQRIAIEKLASSPLVPEEVLGEMDSIFNSMPRCNRDTLAYLIMHLQTVTNSPMCQMNVDNIARIFGPTLVGHNSPENMICQMMEENTIQQKIVKLLLEISEDFYQRFLTESPPRRPFNNLNLINKHPQTVAGYRGKNSFKQRIAASNVSPSYKSPRQGAFENQDFSTIPPTSSFNRPKKIFSSFKHKSRQYL